MAASESWLEVLPEEILPNLVPKCRTTMFRRVSRTLRQKVERLRIPATVRLADCVLSNEFEGVLTEMDSFCAVETVCLSFYAPIHGERYPKGEWLPAFGDALKGLKSLQYVDLSQNEMDGRTIEVLGAELNKFTQLKGLNLAKNGMNDLSAIRFTQQLAELKLLEELNINNHGIGDAGLEAFARVFGRMTALTRLELAHGRRGRVTPAAAEAVAAAIGNTSSLVHVRLSTNDFGKGTWKIVEALMKHTSLQRLDLSDTLKFVGDKNKLQHVGVGKMPSSLAHMVKLKELKIDDNQVGDTGLGLLAKAIGHLTELSCLYAANLGSSPKGAMSLAKGIKKIRALTEVRLGDNKFAAGAGDVVEALVGHPWLRHLDLNGNEIQREDSKKFAAAFSQMTNLKWLNLARNKMEWEADWRISSAFPYMRSLEIVRLDGNHMGDVGVTLISEALRDMTSLCEMYLADNKMTDEGFQRVTEVLTERTSLTFLNVERNQITAEGRRMLRKVGKEGLKAQDRDLRIAEQWRCLEMWGDKSLGRRTDPSLLTVSFTELPPNKDGTRASTEGRAQYSPMPDLQCLRFVK